MLFPLQKRGTRVVGNRTTVRDIHERPQARTMKYYISGGAVRDLLLGRPVRDIDAVFDVPEKEFIQRNPAARKTRTLPHPIYLLHGQEFTPTAEGGPAADVLRRDLTINALLLSAEGVLFAHPRSFQDLRERILRPASPEALAADPVRVFRTARFSAELPDFTVHPDCLEQMRALRRSSALADIAAEQIGRETLKACLAEKPGNFLRLLLRGECLAPWFAELAEADARPAGPPAYHDASVLEHICRVMDATAALAVPGRSSAAVVNTKRQTVAADVHGLPLTEGYPPLPDNGYFPPFLATPQLPENATRALAVWMALCHDLGKCLTPPDELPHHRGHESAGTALANALGTRLRLSRRLIKAGELAAKLHMKAGNYNTLRIGTKVDLLVELHAARILRPFFLMVAADAETPDLPERAEADCTRIMAVSLPEEWQNRGEDSGRRLRELRCQALVEKRSDKKIQGERPLSNRA